MKKAVAIISIFSLLLAAVCAFVIFVLARSDGESAEEVPEREGPAIVWAFYGESRVGIDEDGYAVAISDEPFEGIAQVTGTEIEYAAENEAVQTTSNEALKYALAAAAALSSVGITDADEISISEEGEASVYFGSVVILLGKEENLAEKCADLRKFYGELIDMSGTLDMRSLDTKGTGYTFRKNQ